MVNLARFTKLGKGGHFAPMEVPDVYSAELTRFLKNLIYRIRSKLSEKITMDSGTTIQQKLPGMPGNFC